jgi:hypothetical protein
VSQLRRQRIKSWVLTAGGALAAALSAAAPALAEAPAGSSAAATPAPAAAVAATPGPLPAGVQDAARAWQNWTLNCQGCHRLDGTGSDQTAPGIAGTVAKFLWVPGGREYLARVPGVAASPLGNEELAEVMNWMLWRFDADHLPSTFQPYTGAEIARFRTRPLRLEASQMRAELLRQAEASGPP